MLQLSTILESVVTGLTGVRGYQGGSFSGTGFSGAYDSTGWSWSAQGVIGGAAFGLDYSGVLSGGPADDVAVSFTGVGFVGAEPIEAMGAALWRYDAGLGDYADMTFDHLMRFEANSFWSWVRGAEIIGGGALGGAGALLAAGALTAGTAGLGVGAGVVITGAGALGGASGAVTISEAFRSDERRDTQPPPPNTPLYPTFPTTPTKIGPRRGAIATGLSLNGGMIGFGDDGRTAISGNHQPDGTFAGATATVVPLAPSVLTLLSGLAAFAWLGRRAHRP